MSPNFGTGNPVAAFTANCAGLSCTFDATGSTDTGGTITSYSWNFGDGTPVVTSASPTTTHVYAAPSFYEPALTVTDSTTSISTATKLHAGRGEHASGRVHVELHGPVVRLRCDEVE